MGSADWFLFGFLFGLGGGMAVGFFLGLAAMTPSRKKDKGSNG